MGQTARKFLYGTGFLIGVYLLLSHATDGGKLLTAAGGVYTGGVRVLQGR